MTYWRVSLRSDPSVYCRSEAQYAFEAFREVVCYLEHLRDERDPDAEYEPLSYSQVRCEQYVDTPSRRLDSLGVA